MDFKVASNIYTQPWLIEGHAASELMKLLQEIKAGASVYKRPESSQIQLFAAHSNIITAPTDRYSAKEHPGYEGKSIAIIPVTGPLMKEDYCGYFGTASLRSELARINATESIKQVVFIFSTPGGTVAGTETFANDIKASPKETIGFIEDMCASAGYWLGSSCSKLYCTSKTDIVGSIGTMITITDRSSYMAEQGFVERQYTADASKDKNLMIKQALEGKGKLIIEEWLNPMNDVFVGNVIKNRAGKLNEKETLSGKTFLAEKALELGLVDGIITLKAELENLINKNQTSITMKISSTFKNILAKVGITTATGDVELTPEQLQQIDAALPELATATAKVKELEAAAITTAEKLTGLEASVNAVTKERDLLKKDNETLTAEVERLGKLDGKKVTTPKSEGDRNEEESVEAAEMDFQKELNAKI